MGASKKSKDFKDPKLELYRRILRQIWEDGIVTSDEYAIMEKIRDGLNITLEEHLELESEVYMNLARTQFEKTHHKEAMELYDKATKQAPENELAWMNKGFHLQSLGRSKEAIKCFDRALKLNPKNPQAMIVKGCAYDALGQHNEAIKTYRDALKLTPDDEWVFYNLGMAYFHLGQNAKAAEAFKQALKLKPDFSGPMKYLEMLSEQ
jgi:tetratricopeptide (TPR) repeat protein